MRCVKPVLCTDILSAIYMAEMMHFRPIHRVLFWLVRVLVFEQIPTFCRFKSAFYKHIPKAFAYADGCHIELMPSPLPTVLMNQSVNG